MRVYTIGHSTRTLDDLVAALHSFGIALLADVRTIPRSRHTPQFNQPALAGALPPRGIDYRHLPALGGLRKPRSGSVNAGWRNAGFRGFADYMQTADFAAGLTALRALAAEHGPAAVMCAEAVPWRCHRSLIADALTAGGDEVLHIMAPSKAQRHVLTSFARVEGTRVTYPASEAAGPTDAPGRLPLEEGDAHGSDRTVLHAGDPDRPSVPAAGTVPRRSRRRRPHTD